MYKLIKQPIKRKTRMCRNAKCKFGMNCNYAHNIDEIDVQLCSYGTECLFIFKTNSNCTNKDIEGKICPFIHPLDESLDSYHRRVGNRYSNPPTTQAVAISPIIIDISEWVLIKHPVSSLSHGQPNPQHAPHSPHSPHSLVPVSSPSSGQLPS